MFGVEDLAVFLYALVKMHRPKLMVELGSGSGACALLCAQAMAENGGGKVLSFDNGAQWRRIREDRRLAPYGLETGGSYQQFLSSLARRFAVAEQLAFVEASFPPFPEIEGSIDLLFVDFRDGLEVISAILAHFLLRMSASASIFYDGGSSSAEGFLFLEKLVQDLNNNKFPENIRRYVARGSLDAWRELLHARRFTLMHLTRQRGTQNSTSWIKLEPVDYVPYPVVRRQPVMAPTWDGEAHRDKMEALRKRLLENPSREELETLHLHFDVLEKLESLAAAPTGF
jgi:hypothetical protein